MTASRARAGGTGAGAPRRRPRLSRTPRSPGRHSDGAGSGTDPAARACLHLNVGDLIVFGKDTSQEIKLDGEEYLITREHKVPAVSGSR